MGIYSVSGVLHLGRLSVGQNCLVFLRTVCLQVDQHGGRVLQCRQCVTRTLFVNRFIDGDDCCVYCKVERGGN